MVKALFDANIPIDCLNAVLQARSELRRYDESAITIVTWIEVMLGAGPDVEVTTRADLAGFDILGVDREVAERAVQLRRSLRIRLSDAIIWATAQTHAMLPVTRNIKDFPANDPGTRTPYSL